MVDAINQGDKIESIEIVRVGADAQKFNAVEAFRTFEGAREKRLAAEIESREAELDQLAAGFKKTNSGYRKYSYGGENFFTLPVSFAA